MMTWENQGAAIEFFHHRETWQRYITRNFPTASITRECIGRRVVYRAFYRRHKVGVFGRLRGFGYATGTFAAGLMHGRQPAHP